MPKIDVNEELFFKTLGRRLEKDASSSPLLTAAKAELDDWPKGEGVLRIELNDTNRPDLWSTLGLARQLSIYLTGKVPAVPVLLPAGDVKDTGERRVVVDKGLKDIRPYIGSFVAEGQGSHRRAPAGDHPVPGEALRQLRPQAQDDRHGRLPRGPRHLAGVLLARRTRTRRSSCRWISTGPCPCGRSSPSTPRARSTGPSSPASRDSRCSRTERERCSRSRRSSTPRSSAG